MQGLIRPMQRSRNPPGPLGPQCLSCRRRRVKCDSATPTCRRCGRDSLQCPGYTKQTKVIQYIPIHPNQGTNARALSYTSRHRQEPSENDSLFVDNMLPRRTIHAPGEDRDMLCLHDSIKRYNRSIIQDSRSAHPILRRNLVQESTPWHLLPTLLQHMFIITFQSLHAAKRSSDPLSSSMICHYRSLGLHELRQNLLEAVEDPSDIALGAILLLMGVDVLSSPSSSWSFHFNAARKVIALRGGMLSCLKNSPDLTQLFVDYMILDVFSCTTCKITDMFPDQSAMTEHWSYIDLLPQLEKIILPQVSACPLPIIQAIVRTNLSRVATHVHGKYQISINKKGLNLVSEFECIVRSINEFQPNHWALQILNDRSVGPKRIEDVPPPTLIAGISSIGRLYQCAALLYATMSCPDTDRLSHEASLSHAQEIIRTEVDSLVKLTCGLQNILLRKLVWKCFEWPLFVSSYTSIMRSDADGGANTILKRVREIADIYGSRRLRASIAHLNDVQALRRAVSDRSWTWDDGFNARCVFGV